MSAHETFDLAIQYYRSGDLHQAESICIRMLEVNPDDADVLNCLGIIYFRSGKHERAIDNMKRALQIDPNFVEAHSNLGSIYHANKELDEAISYYRKALQIDPALGQTYFYLGVAFQEKGQFDKAISYYQCALQLNFNSFALYFNLGLSFEKQHRLEEAFSCYQNALKLNPNSAEIYNNVGNVLIKQGSLDEGTSYFRKALQLQPNYSLALLNLVKNPRLSYDDSKEILNLLENCLKQNMSENDRKNTYFAIGKIYENLKMYKESFKYYRLGNILKRTQLKFNIESHIDYLSRIKNTFSSEFINQRKSSGNKSQMPIFIFGMPRSGTTLVEQIIASHPNVYGAGELLFFSQIDEKLPSFLNVNELYPECSNYINDRIANDIAELYLTGIKNHFGLSKGYIRIIDKNPFNFYYLGLISLLFPKASFIHCKRHPLDTCVSICFHEFEVGHNFAYDLSELGQYYLEYLRLMDHWHRVLSIDIFEVHYEDVVQHQEEVSRKLIEFCGLKWDSACLNFYKKERPVFTASKWQVRQPIYTTSCGRWHNYEQFIYPLKELLADFISPESISL